MAEMQKQETKPPVEICEELSGKRGMEETDNLHFVHPAGLALF